MPVDAVDELLADRDRSAATPARRPRRSSAATRATRLEARLLAGDEAGAWTIIESALVAGMAPDAVDLDVVVPALRSIGDRWARGELTVADEHRASGVAARLVGRLGTHLRPRGRRRGTIVIGAAPGDRHGLPTAVVADVLRSEGFDVIDLGADSPPEAFIDAARNADRLRLVGIVVTHPDAAGNVADVVAALRRCTGEVPIAVGGAAIADIDEAAAIGADVFTGHDGRGAVDAMVAAASG